MIVDFGLIEGEKLIVDGKEPVWSDGMYRTITKPNRVKVCKEYPRFIHVKSKHYDFCIDKNDIKTGVVLVRKVMS